jgi:hypothetical protein
MGKYTATVQDHLILPARVRLTPGREQERRFLGQLIPAPIPIRLLIDTGSKRTTLIPGIIRHLQPNPGGEAHVHTALGEAATSLSWVCLEFPATGLATLPEVHVAHLPMPPALSQFHGLLGRDLLRRLASFEYEGQRGCYTLRDRPGLLGGLRRWL